LWAVVSTDESRGVYDCIDAAGEWCEVVGKSDGVRQLEIGRFDEDELRERRGRRFVLMVGHVFWVAVSDDELRPDVNMYPPQPPPAKGLRSSDLTCKSVHSTQSQQ
jgi:hypothetical protein